VPGIETQKSAEVTHKALAGLGDLLKKDE